MSDEEYSIEAIRDAHEYGCNHFAPMIKNNIMLLPVVNTAEMHRSQRLVLEGELGR